MCQACKHKCWRLVLLHILLNKFTQVSSMEQQNVKFTKIREFVKKNTEIKPIGTDGLNNCEWVAMDYSDVMVHIFLPEIREYYNLEHLWADAKLTAIPDLD